MKRKYWILLGVASLLILFDQWTKNIVIDKFKLNETLVVISNFFNLTYIRNPGAAFGFLANSNPAFRGPFFVLVPLVALGAIGYVFKKIPEGDLKLALALSMVVGGAIGNLIDRLRFGYVVDFLDFHWKYQYHFPAFNVADSAICVGVGILMLDLFLKKENPENASPAS